MAGRKEGSKPLGIRPGNLGRAAGLSLLLHLAVLVGLAVLVRRGRRLPPVEDVRSTEIVDVSPVEVPVPEGLPPWPTPGQPQTDIPAATAAAAHNTRAPADAVTEPAPRRRPPPPPRPRPSAPITPRDRDDQDDHETARPPPPETSTRATTKVTPEPVPPKAAPSPAPVLAEGAPPPDGSAGPPSPDAGAAAVAAAEGPTTGVIGIGAAGGSPLALFVGLLNNQVRGLWHPKEVYQNLDPLGRLPNANFVTILDVRIRADGNLERVSVHTSCGSSELDEEAVASFRRARAFPHPPAEMLDKSGSFALQFSFLLDVSTFHFASQVQHQVLEGWRGSPAFNRAGDRARTTFARMLLTKDGVLVHALLLGSAGMDFLDEGVLRALPPGLHLPAPPPAYIRHPGLVPVDVQFTHNVHGSNGVRVLRPSEAVGTK